MYGVFNSNDCPANSARIEDEEGCRRAAAAAGKYFAGAVNDDDYPKGCYFKPSRDYVRFNAHLFGDGSSSRLPLCAASATTVLVDTSANTAATLTSDVTAPSSAANSLRCGADWADAEAKCGTPCPGGLPELAPCGCVRARLPRAIAWRGLVAASRRACFVAVLQAKTQSAAARAAASKTSIRRRAKPQPSLHRRTRSLACFLTPTKFLTVRGSFGRVLPFTLQLRHPAAYTHA